MGWVEYSKNHKVHAEFSNDDEYLKKRAEELKKEYPYVRLVIE